MDRGHMDVSSEHPIRAPHNTAKEGSGSPPWLPYLSELLLLPRRDGEVQDVVEAVGGCTEAGLPPEV